MESSIWDLEDFKFGFVRSCINIGESKTGFSLFQFFFFGKIEFQIFNYAVRLKLKLSIFKRFSLSS